VINLLESMHVPQSKSEQALITIWLLLEKNRLRLYRNTWKVVVIWGSRGFEIIWEFMNYNQHNVIVGFLE